MRFKSFIIILVLIAVSATGCNTLSGAYKGMTEDGEAVKNWVDNEDNDVKKADDWVKKNLW